MRVFLVAATAALAAATPASLAAQEAVPDPEFDEPEMGELVDRLEDPAEQERLAAMLGTMGEVILALPVGPMMEAVATARGEDPAYVDRDATVGDLAGPEAERLPGEMANKVPQMMGMMAGMVESIDAMRPMLEAMANTFRAQIEHGGS